MIVNIGRLARAKQEIEEWRSLMRLEKKAEKKAEYKREFKKAKNRLLLFQEQLREQGFSI